VLVIDTNETDLVTLYGGIERHQIEIAEDNVTRRLNDLARKNCGIEGLVAVETWIAVAMIDAWNMLAIGFRGWHPANGKRAA
jgi:hypothetical protein